MKPKNLFDERATYVAPQVDLMEIVAEHGFAQSAARSSDLAEFEDVTW